MQEIADKTGIPYSTVQYYFREKYNIPRRSWSEATYVKRNPNGDPFNIKKKLSFKETELKGLGLGLYWGEGNKLSKNSIRLGNTDPNLIKKFIEFLVKIYGVDPNKLRFGLQIFSDIEPKKALSFWLTELKEFNIKQEQFQKKIIVTPSHKKGTYKNKIQHGVLMVACHNKKLKEIIDKMLG